MSFNCQWQFLKVLFEDPPNVSSLVQKLFKKVQDPIFWRTFMRYSSVNESLHKIFFQILHNWDSNWPVNDTFHRALAPKVPSFNSFPPPPEASVSISKRWGALIKGQNCHQDQFSYFLMWTPFQNTSRVFRCASISRFQAVSGSLANPFFYS